MSKAEQFKFIIDSLTQNERVDKFLSRNIKEISRSKIKLLIEGGSLKINDRTTTSCKYILKSEDSIVLAVQVNKSVQKQSFKLENLELEILHEDEDILVINKPAGLLVHPGAGRRDQNTLIDYIREHCGNSLSSIAGEARPGIVHRLDLETSGVMVIAKNDRAHSILATQFQNREVEKRYFAITKSVISPKFGTIKTFLKKSSADKTKVYIASNGKEAITKYSVKEEYCDGKFSLLDIELLTGRTHQIRVQLEYKKCPIIGDKVYGRNLNFHFAGKEYLIKQIEKFPRHALHAYKLCFIHPNTGENIGFEAEMPQDMLSLIRTLKSI